MTITEYSPNITVGIGNNNKTYRHRRRTVRPEVNRTNII